MTQVAHPNDNNWVISKNKFLICVIDQALFKREVKITGYWPSSFLRTRPIYSRLDQTSLVNKRYIIWTKGELFCGICDAGNPVSAG